MEKIPVEPANVAVHSWDVSIGSYIKARMREVKARRELAMILRDEVGDLARSDWPRSLSDPTSFYCDAVRYFHSRLPEKMREHRFFFSKSKRGFGEDAFHVLWYLLVSEFRPRTFLEIGVYRGQTLSLVSLLSSAFNVPCAVNGISPFSSAGDSVSRYDESIDYLADTLKNFDRFGLQHPRLLNAYSTDPEARSFIASIEWDAVYIDGNHEYEVVRQDWENCSAHVRIGGFIVLDDAALGTSFKPPMFATAGHPGPSRLAREITGSSFEEILRVGHNRVFLRKS